MDGDRVVGPAVRRGVAGREARDRVRVVDQPLRAEEARGELPLVTGGAHRDGDVNRLLARAGGADRQRLLAAQPVLALLDGAGAVRGDRDPGRLALDGDRLGVHARIVAPASPLRRGDPPRHSAADSTVPSRNEIVQNETQTIACRGPQAKQSIPPTHEPSRRATVESRLEYGELSRRGPRVAGRLTALTR